MVCIMTERVALNRRKLLLLAAAWMAFAVPVAIFAQAAASPAAKKDFKEFDVASVKENKSDDQASWNFPLGSGDAYVPNGGHFKVTDLPLSVYINFAYKLSASQATEYSSQLPDWAKTSRYDIEARVEGDPNKDDMRAMMRALLAERFGLKIHTEMREMSVLDLVVAKPGVTGKMLRPHPADDTSCPKDNVDARVMNGKVETPKDAADGFPGMCGVVVGMPSKPGQIKLGARNISMALFASTIPGPGNLGKLVVDKTGLTGRYDFTLEFAPDAELFPPGSSIKPDETAPSFLNALTEQLGLKVTADKGQEAVLIVDHVERPSEN